LTTIGKHCNIIEYKGFCENAVIRIPGYGGQQSSTKPILAFEFAHNRTILNYLLSLSYYIEEKWTRYWFRHILDGLKHMKDKGFSHLDIKCENIMLDKNLTAKLGDFGYSQLNNEGINMTTCSFQHRAPEIFN